MKKGGRKEQRSFDGRYSITHHNDKASRDSDYGAGNDHSYSYEEDEDAS